MYQKRSFSKKNAAAAGTSSTVYSSASHNTAGAGVAPPERSTIAGDLDFNSNAEMAVQGGESNERMFWSTRYAVTGFALLAEAEGVTAVAAAIYSGTTCCRCCCYI